MTCDVTKQHWCWRNWRGRVASEHKLLSLFDWTVNTVTYPVCRHLKQLLEVITSAVCARFSLNLAMGLTVSNLFNRLFGKKQMRILMGENICHVSVLVLYLSGRALCPLALICCLLLRYQVTLHVTVLSVACLSLVVYILDWY